MSLKFVKSSKKQTYSTITDSESSEKEETVLTLKGEVISKNKYEEIAEKAEREEKEKETYDILKGEKGLSRIYVENNKQNIKLYNGEGGKPHGFQYNEITGMWDSKPESYFVSELSTYLENYINEKIKSVLDDIKKDSSKKHLIDNKELTQEELCTKLLKVMVDCRKTIKCKNIFALSEPYLRDPDFLSKINMVPYLLAFKNGVYDLKLGVFRKAQRDDYLSLQLNYDYIEDYAEKDKESEKKHKEMKKITKEVEEDLKRICNDSEEDYNFLMSFFGYSCTGEISEKKFLVGIGETASNGKSTTLEIFNACLPIYCEKMNRDVFTLGYQKTHKQFARLKYKPIRLIYVEELSSKAQDVTLIKDVVGGKKIGNNEILFGTAEDIKINFKIVIISNYNVIFKPDKGMQRRGLLKEFTNVFLEPAEYEKRKGEKGVYPINLKLTNKYEEDDRYKLAFAKLMINRARTYYKEGLTNLNKYKSNFAALAEENDTMAIYIDENYEITKDEKHDRIHKEEFLLNWNTKHKTKSSWSQIMSDVKRFLKYDKDAKVDGKRGCLMGVRYKILKMDDDDSISLLDK